MAVLEHETSTSPAVSASIAGASTFSPPGLEIPLAEPGQFRRGALGRLCRQQTQRWYIQIAIIELSLLLLACQLAVYTRFGFEYADIAPTINLYPWKASIFAVIVWLSMLALGLYQRHGQQPGTMLTGTLLRVALALSAGAAGLMIIYFIIPSAAMGRGLLTLALAWSLVLLTCARVGFIVAIRGDLFKRRILLLGCGRRARDILRRAQSEESSLASTLVGCISLPTDIPADPSEEKWSIAQIKPSASLLKTCLFNRIDDIVIAADEMRNHLGLQELVACRLAGIGVLRVDSFYEREFGRVMLEQLLPSWFVFGTSFNQSLLRRVGKRGFDLSCAAVISLLATPLMVLVAGAIWVESGFRGPILYRQVRVGEGGREFRLVKFRSMREDAENDGVARWAQSNDMRVTPVGRIIRQLRLDELPQLWNVFRGEMSIVGPRPERPEFVADLRQQIPYYGVRHCVVPGLTGWAQLRYPYGACVADALEKLRYDLFYIKHQSLVFDLQILLQTVEVVLFRRGSR